MADDQLLAFRNAALRVVHRYPVLVREAKYLSRQFARAANDNDRLDMGGIHQALIRLPGQVRKEVYGTAQANLDEIRSFKGLQPISEADIEGMSA